MMTKIFGKVFYNLLQDNFSFFISWFSLRVNILLVLQVDDTSLMLSQKLQNPSGFRQLGLPGEHHSGLLLSSVVSLVHTCTAVQSRGALCRTKNPIQPGEAVDNSGRRHSKVIARHREFTGAAEGASSFSRDLQLHKCHLNLSLENHLKYFFKVLALDAESLLRLKSVLEEETLTRGLAMVRW